MSNMLTYLNILILAWLNVLSICDSEWVVDSDQIYGIKEPDGFTRENISCSPELSIVITSIVYGYKVRNDLVNSEELYFCFIQDTNKIPLCGESMIEDKCHFNLSPANLDCDDNVCHFPTKDDWKEVNFDSADCQTGSSLIYWHVCYDCMMHMTAGEDQVYFKGNNNQFQEN